MLSYINTVLLNLLDANIAVRWSIAARLWGIFSSILTIIFIYTHFTPDMQGYYYAFMSLLATQMLADLGFNTVTLFYTRNEWAKLNQKEQIKDNHKEEANKNIIRIFKTVSTYYVIVATILTLLLATLGTHFLGKQSENEVKWLLPWIALCPLVGLNILFSLSLTFLEGCNYLNSVYAARFYQAFINSCVIWITITLGGGLWSLPLGAFFGLLAGFIFCDRDGWKFINQKINEVWRKPLPFIFAEMWPMQWRIAISSVSAYATFSLAVPLAFNFLGPATAGQLGLSLSISFAVITISGSFLSPSAALFASHVSLKQYHELDKLFFKQIKISFALSTLLVIIVIALKIPLENNFSNLTSRILPNDQLIWLLSASVCQSTVAPILVYVRAHREDPTFLFSAFFALLIALFSYFYLGNNNVQGFTQAYFFLSLLCVPVWFYFWRYFRKIRH